MLAARQGALPRKLLHYYQPASQGLFLPVAPGSDYITIAAAGEAWFAMGDMTMAEHATLLGMIFSPRHTGTRALRRLAEINLIVGDDAAAMKYLRLLQKTHVHRRWAEQRMPGRQTEEVKNRLAGKRRLLPERDTLRLAGDVTRSLRHLLEGNPNNRMALDYLLCFHLLNKNIPAFVEDYRTYASHLVPTDIYAEAWLIYLAGTEAPAEEWARMHIPEETLAAFEEYNSLYEANKGHGAALYPKYGRTYWFYFHYAMLKEKEE